MFWILPLCAAAPAVPALSEEASAAVRASAIRLAKQDDSLDPAAVEAALRDQIAASLIDKVGRGFPLDADTIRRTVVDYELFKAEKFVSSGVFPKRYFGYLDERFDTAELERRLRRTIQAGVDETNALLARSKSRQRITEMEVAITFLAEGGALMLAAPDAYDLRRIHPIQGVGLDDITIGFEQHPDLIARLDARLETNLAAVVDRSGHDPRLAKYLTFEEAIAGTIVMWVYEKELAAAKLANAENKRLETLPLDEQFIFSSLVYNSGLIFGTQRMKQIRDFQTAAYLDRVSRDNEKRRWRLPLFDAPRAIAFLLDRHAYPAQPTSWSAVYHVLQRYGAYAAIAKFTDVFDDQGRFVVR